MYTRSIFFVGFEEAGRVSSRNLLEVCQISSDGNHNPLNSGTELGRDLYFYWKFVEAVQ